MNTKAPRDCSTASAIGCAGKRENKTPIQASMASGVCWISPCSRCPVSAACQDQTCFWSAQSMATKAPKLGSPEEMGCGWLFTLPPFSQAPRFRERLIVESWNRSRRHLSISFWKRSRLPLLEPLLENIECWPVELVAAGGLQPHLSLIRSDCTTVTFNSRNSGLSGVAFACLDGSHGYRRSLHC